MVSGAGEGNRTLLPSVSFRRKACHYEVSGLSRLLVSAQFVTVFSTLSRHVTTVESSRFAGLRKLLRRSGLSAP